MYEFVGAKGCLIVMFYLYSNGPSTKYSLVRNLKLSKEAISHAVDILEELGLCEVETSEEFPFTKTLSLTMKGHVFMKTPVRELPAVLWRQQEDRLARNRVNRRKGPL